MTRRNEVLHHVTTMGKEAKKKRKSDGKSTTPKGKGTASKHLRIETVPDEEAPTTPVATPAQMQAELMKLLASGSFTPNGVCVPVVLPTNAKDDEEEISSPEIDQASTTFNAGGTNDYKCGKDGTLQFDFTQRKRASTKATLVEREPQVHFQSKTHSGQCLRTPKQTQNVRYFRT